MIKVGGYILGEFGNLIAGDSRSRYALLGVGVGEGVEVARDCQSC